MHTGCVPPIQLLKKGNDHTYAVVIAQGQISHDRLKTVDFSSSCTAVALIRYRPAYTSILQFIKRIHAVASSIDTRF